MRRTISLLLATLFVVLGVTIFPVVYYLWEIQQPEVIERVLDPTIVYALGIPAVIVELEKEKDIRALDGTVLELDRSDLNFLLQTSFTEVDVERKALEVHKSIVDHVRQGPKDTFSFSISTVAERPIIQKNLVRLYRRKMNARHECSMGQFLGIAWNGVRKLFGVKKPSEEEQLRTLPHCRPPKMVQEAVMSAVAKRLEKAQEHSADSVHVIPKFGRGGHLFVRRSLELGQTGAWFLPVFPILLAIIGIISWRDRRACYARLAAPLLISGLILLLMNATMYYFAPSLDLFATIQKMDPAYRMSESTSQWLRIVFYVVQGVAVLVARKLALLGAFLILAGLVTVRLHRTCRTPSAIPQIDPIPVPN
ncbi:MAG: hypothetical protein ABI679_03860 [Gemmatimonadota bacterium]